jgi:hypothetical protein
MVYKRGGHKISGCVIYSTIIMLIQKKRELGRSKEDKRVWIL